LEHRSFSSSDHPFDMASAVENGGASAITMDDWDQQVLSFVSNSGELNDNVSGDAFVNLLPPAVEVRGFPNL
jgi:hypothetical protein